MKINKEIFQTIKSAPNSAYNLIKPYFLFHSNKMEGSTFDENEILQLIEQKQINGQHTLDDLFKTLNSIEVFDNIIDNLDCEITHDYLISLNTQLLKNTTKEREGFTGHYKEIPNRIVGSHIEVSLPKDVQNGIEKLLSRWENSDKTIDDIAKFHAKFEHIHPFQDGNGRIGRFLILKQCIENDLDLVFIDSNNEKPYKAWLEVAQTQKNYTYLKEILVQSQHDLDVVFEEKGITRLIPQYKSSSHTKIKKSCPILPTKESKISIGKDKNII